MEGEKAVADVERKQNDKLDLFKCVAIYSTIFAHAPLPGAVGQLLAALAKFSVVVFFLSSGYFSWEKNSRTLGGRSLRMGKLLLETSVMLLLFGCVLAVKGGQSVSAYLLSRMNPLFLKEIVLYQVLPFPYAWPMWYLTAQFMVYVIWWSITYISERLGKRLPYNVLGAAALGLLLLHLSLGEWRAMTGQTPLSNMYLRNTWLDGLPFFTLGVWMREHREGLQTKGNVHWLWCGVAVSVLLAVWEHSRVGVVDVFVGTTLVAFLLVWLSLCSPQISSPWLRRTACWCGKNLTFYIYVIHVPLYGVIKEWAGQVPAFAWSMGRPWMMPFLIAFLSTLAALAIYFRPWRKRQQR